MSNDKTDDIRQSLEDDETMGETVSEGTDGDSPILTLDDGAGVDDGEAEDN